MPRGKQNSDIKVHKNQKSFHYIMICYANNIQGHTFLFIDVTWRKHLKGEAYTSSTQPQIPKTIIFSALKQGEISYYNLQISG